MPRWRSPRRRRKPCRLTIDSRPRARSSSAPWGRNERRANRCFAARAGSRLRPEERGGPACRPGGRARHPRERREGAAEGFPRLPRRPRDGDRLQDGDGALAGGRQARRGAVPRGAGSEEGRRPRADRSAPVPDPAPHGGRRPRPRPGPALRGEEEPVPVRGSLQAQAHRRPAGGRSAGGGRAVRGSGAHRPRRNRNSEAQPHLRADHLAHRRRRRHPQRRSRKPRPRERHDRHRHRRAARSHRGHLHPAARHPAAARRGVPAGLARGPGTRARWQRGAGAGKARSHRQRHQSHHRDAAPEGGAAEPAARVVAEPVRQGAAPPQHADGCDRDAARRRAARTRRCVRLRRAKRSNGAASSRADRSAAGRGGGGGKGRERRAHRRQGGECARSPGQQARGPPARPGPRRRTAAAARRIDAGGERPAAGTAAPGQSLSISEPFIRRPVATTLLTVGLLLAGLTGYKQLAVSALPQVDYPTIQVSTTLPGASADTMASAVTTPLERQFGQMPSLTQMTSVSSFGSSQITLQFSLERSIDAAEQDVQAAINASSNLLPRTLPAPPTYSKSNPADTPILTLAVTSDSLPLDVVDDQADSILAQKISQVSGVGLVAINGGQKPAVRVQIDPAALAGAGLTLEDVRSVLTLANVNQPKGNLDGPRLDYAIATDDQLYKAEEFRPLILAYRNGSPIRLREIGDVIDGVENTQLAGWAGRKRAIILNVQRQPGANVIQVADRVKALLPQLKATLPQGLVVNILSDRTETVRASVHDVQFTLVLTIVLVVAVIYLCLGSLRATVIPGVAVPLSLIGTFGVMKLCGYSLDNLSLMALTISTGFVVDDAIVMVENVSRFIEAGKKPFEAALEGSKQIGFTIVSLTVSLVAVLIPLLFMGGLIGRLFSEFAVTLSIAIVISALLSLTLTAMMCAHLLKPHGEEKHSRLTEASERGFEWMIEKYSVGVDWVLRHQFFTLVVTIATLALTAFLAVVIPKGFFPLQDTGLLVGVTEAGPDVSFPRMLGLQQQLAEVALSDPDVASVASFIGADGTNPTSNSGRLSITLKPRKERGASAQEIIDRLRPKFHDVEGCRCSCNPSRICKSRAGRAVRSSSTRSRMPIPTSLRNGRQRWRRRCARSRSFATWRATCRLRVCSSSSPSTATPPRG